MDAVHFQKCEHDIHPNPLVSVQKGMVGNQMIAESGALFFLCWVELLSAKAGKSNFQRRFQKPLIPYSDASTGFLREQLVQQQNFFL